MHIHILGICGTFMGGLAALAREAGHRVTGCDDNVYPPMSDQLRALGIDPKTGKDFGANDEGIGRKLIDVLIDRQREIGLSAGEPPAARAQNDTFSCTLRSAYTDGDCVITTDPASGKVLTSLLELGFYGVPSSVVPLDTMA